MESIEALLLRVEQGVHRFGWDVPPQLAMLHKGPDGRLRMESILREFPDPSHFLKSYGFYLVNNPHTAKKVVEALPTLWGAALITEAWMAPAGISDDEREELARTGRSIADFPGALECRMVTVVDLDGNHYSVQRVRGRKPEYWAESEVRSHGEVFVGLRSVVTALALHLPQGCSQLIERMRGSEYFAFLQSVAVQDGPGTTVVAANRSFGPKARKSLMLHLLDQAYATDDPMREGELMDQAVVVDPAGVQAVMEGFQAGFIPEPGSETWKELLVLVQADAEQEKAENS